MGLFDFLKGKAYRNGNVSGNLPVPINTRINYGFGGYGSGEILSFLQRRLPGSLRDWSKEAGDLGLNSIISISLDFYIRNWTQAKFKVKNQINANEFEYINHPIIDLLNNPDSSVCGSVFWSYVVQDYKLLGNAYVRKIRVNGNVVRLQYLPADMMKPLTDNKNDISYWVYTVDGESFKLPVEDIIHFKYLRDPDNIFLGRSPITSVLREIATDNAASSTAFGLMKNNALPSIILGPDSSDFTVDISPDDAKTVKKRLMQDFVGDNAGGVAVMTGAYKLDRISWSPEEMVLDKIRKMPEERIVAAMGLNVMVLGLGSGLEHSTYSNYERAQQAAWEDGMIPLQNQIIEVLNNSLMYEFSETKDNYYLCFDYSNVKALADDVVTQSSRAERLYVSGVCTRAEAKRIAGLPVSVEDENVYFNLPYTATNGERSLLTNQEDYNNVNKFLKAYPTEGMKTAAKRALQWKEEGFDGGTRIGLARANQIVNGDNLSDDTILRMYSFFSRHEVDKRATGFSSGEEGYPSNGRVAWDLWGGDAGFSFAKKNRDRIIKEDDEN
jgi:HK97 family phage portal protein